MRAAFSHREEFTYKRRPHPNLPPEEKGLFSSMILVLQSWDNLFAQQFDGAHSVFVGERTALGFQ